MQCATRGCSTLDDPVVDVPPGGAGTPPRRSARCSRTAPGMQSEPAARGGSAARAGRSPSCVAANDGGRAVRAGTHYHYSNLGYGLLGEVVARLRGRTWWECLASLVLEPLGMLRTTYDPFDPHARGYSVHPWSGELVAEPATDTRAMAPAGQVWSTVLDLATFADFLIGGRDEVLLADTVEEMVSLQSGTGAAGLDSGYGLGVRLVPGGSGVRVGHTGSMPGFQACLLVDRPRRTGVVVLANSTTGLVPDRVAGRLLDTLEEAEPTMTATWRPTTRVPREVSEVLGVWYWGNTPSSCRWDGRRVRARSARGHVRRLHVPPAGRGAGGDQRLPPRRAPDAGTS